MAYATARKTESDIIPVIDLSEIESGKIPQNIAEALLAASKNLGFIYVSGHGIPDALIESARQGAYDFFHQDADEKSAVQVSSRHRGWLKPGGAKMQDDAKPDLKESFIWGYQDESGHTDEDHPLRGQNQWPPLVPHLEELATDYFDAVQNVAITLMRAFAVGLELDEDFFLTHCSRPLSRASFVYYPPQGEHLGKDQFGVAPHTDFGMLTVLCQDNTGGLQVQGLDGVWIEAPPIEGTLVVNVGDLLCRWTNGAFKSTPHRVVNSSGKERMSLVLAFDPDPETLVDPASIPDLPQEDAEVPITCGDYLIWRFAKAFAYRKSEKL